MKCSELSAQILKATVSSENQTFAGKVAEILSGPNLAVCEVPEGLSIPLALNALIGKVYLPLFDTTTTIELVTRYKDYFPKDTDLLRKMHLLATSAFLHLQNIDNTLEETLRYFNEFHQAHNLYFKTLGDLVASKVNDPTEKTFDIV